VSPTSPTAPVPRPLCARVKAARYGS
jgi:hypothetical protein